MNNAVVASAALVIGAASLLLLKSKRRWWVRPWIEKRDHRGNFTLNEEFIQCNDLGSFKNFMRMDLKTFNMLLAIVKQDIERQNTHLRNSISAHDRLVITLRYLATGESFRSLQYSFRIGQSTISSIIPETCRSLYSHLKKDYLKVPTKVEEWHNIAQEFELKWNLPNVLGAMDGKHICFRSLRSDGSQYFNYKQEHSIVLLALVDANYKFIYVDAGTNGRVSDGGVFQKSHLKRAIENNALNFPEERCLPHRNKPVPFVIVADAAFPLQNNILKPYPFRNMTFEQRIFNYRLSRCRRVVENAFGILANKWRCLLSPLQLSVEKVELITLTCCALHNFLRVHCPLDCENTEDAGVDRRFTFRYSLSQQAGNRSRQSALSIREEFMQYVNKEGVVEWQHNKV